MHYQRNDEIKTTLMPDGHVVLFNTKTEWAQVLNPVGALVWEYCDGTTSVMEMTDEISKLLETDKTALQNDVNSLIDELLTQGLIKQAQPSKP
ncbi:MAG: PqqD family protein [Candidatus Obscuribacterales bacterium]|nr:PqqD family protein [Candidatus Obscuribacterales bacterium]